jgi:phosphoribosyl 1,2-cyclic phosphodiesterase
MKIRCWGARGSIPVSGRNYQKYGGDTTCIEIRTKNNEIIIIDAGSGIRPLGNQLQKENQREFHIIFTHAHWDHLMGFPFFKPIYQSQTKLSIWGSNIAQHSIQGILSQTMSEPYFPVNFADIKATVDSHEFNQQGMTIDSVKIEAIPLSHPNKGFGYKFIENGKSFVFLTDNELSYQHPEGLLFDDYLNFCRGVDLLIHDAEFKPEEYQFTRTWGHSVYLDALDLALQAGVKQFGLFHHNQDRSDDEVDDMVRNCQEQIQDTNADLVCFAAYQKQQILL